MNQPDPHCVNFDDLVGRLPADRTWEYDCGAKRKHLNVAKSAIQTLQTPLDFPPLSAAIVPGDRIALVVDPNVPQLVDVIQGVLESISQTEAEAVDIVLWDEATDVTVNTLGQRFANTATVIRHCCDDRASLRYLAADEAGQAIYLSRVVVDADFVLPIIAGRLMDRACQHDLTGVFPSMCDSATRNRHWMQISRPDEDIKERNEDQIPWLLGVHLMMSVKASATGQAGEIVAGTPEAIGKLVSPIRQASGDFPPAAPLVIASLDGDAQQQTWQNAARGAVAVSRYAQPGGTIVLWTAIDSEPQGKLSCLDEFDHAAVVDAGANDTSVDSQGQFPAWQAGDGLAYSLARTAADFRLLIHSQLPRDVIESMGIGVVESVGELLHLLGTFDSCGVLRAAQFAGSTLDAPHRLGLET